MPVIADLQLHSKYSRAVSREMVIPVMAQWGKRKGLQLLATGDWLHSLWLIELQANLQEVAEGIYEAKSDPGGTKFLLSTEISSIYTQGGRVRRVHTLIFAPNFAVARRINEELLRRGCNLSSDGRPIVGLSCRQLAEIVLSIDAKCLLIPAHCWTPHFSVYGSRGGFDSLAEAFGEYTDKIYAVESGLSSDPGMNWRIKELERRAIVSFSDAHSPMKLGREATVFSFQSSVNSNKFSYDDVYWAIAERYLGENAGKLKIDYTIEFYPEEGKYHLTGHRNCGVKGAPGVCPKCGRPLTVGVMDRVKELGSEVIEATKKIERGAVFNYHPTDKTRPPYVMLVPLAEILAQVHGVGVGAKTVMTEYLRLVNQYGSEIKVLFEADLPAIDRVRRGEIKIDPGYDGEYGKVKITSNQLSVNSQQMGLF